MRAAAAASYMPLARLLHTSDTPLTHLSHFTMACSSMLASCSCMLHAVACSCYALCCCMQSNCFTDLVPPLSRGFFSLPERDNSPPPPPPHLLLGMRQHEAEQLLLGPRASHVTLTFLRVPAGRHLTRLLHACYKPLTRLTPLTSSLFCGSPQE